MTANKNTSTPVPFQIIFLRIVFGILLVVSVYVVATNIKPFYADEREQIPLLLTMPVFFINFGLWTIHQDIYEFYFLGKKPKE